MNDDNPPLKKLFSYKKYKELAGIDWPIYQDFIDEKPIKNSLIRHEIQHHIKEARAHFLENKQRSERSESWALSSFIVKLVLPGVIGLGIYFFAGGSLIKMFLIFLGFYVINFLHNFAVHRWLSHHQIEPKKWAKYLLLWVTTTIGIYRNSFWVKHHRCHHQYGETEWDPYPARFGRAKLIMNINHDIHPKWKKFKYFNDRDIDFVENHYFKLYFLNLFIFILIDIDIVLLSFAFLRLYTFVIHGYSSWRFHQAKLDGIPDNIPIYWEFLFGGDALHKEHHDDPRKFNCSIPGRPDPAYYLMRWIAK